MKKTWQYQENGCPTCNGTGVIEQVCARWNDPKHTARNCSCNGGTVRKPCPNSKCVRGELRR